MAKNKNDIMYVKEVRNKRDELSFELHCSGKDPLTKKNKVYVRTFKVPVDLKTKKSIEAFRLQCQLEYQTEVKRISNGIIDVKKKTINFCDYADECIERIIKNNPESYHHYTNSKWFVKILKEKLGLYNINEITRPVVQKLCDWICGRTYVKETYIVKNDLRAVLASKNLTQVAVSKACGFTVTTLGEAFRINHRISKGTATALCNYLGVNVYDYFTVIKEERAYSKSVNNLLVNLLRLILREAVKDGLIEHNYAKSEYIRKITGTAGKKEIFEDTETIQRFNQAILSEPDIRKKAAFSISLGLGLRGAEISGLSWADIDFDKKEVHINKNTLYVAGFGTITKSTKTDSSNRVISMPDNLVQILKEYKLWWDKEKIQHGDLWVNTDKLFVRNNGQDMTNATIATWLSKFEKQHGFKHVTLHGLRHTNITLQIVHDQDVRTVSARAGHSNVSTTLNIYTHYFKEADKKSADLLDKILYN